MMVQIVLSVVIKVRAYFWRPILKLMLHSVTCYVAMLCQCRKPCDDKNYALLTSNNLCSIVVTVAYVLAHVTDGGL